LTRKRWSDTVCHMKSITIRELHEKTGEWVRLAAHYGEVTVTDRGRTIAKIIPQAPEPEAPYFARRRPGSKAAAIMNRPAGGTDSTTMIAEDRAGR